MKTLRYNENFFQSEENTIKIGMKSRFKTLSTGKYPILLTKFFIVKAALKNSRRVQMCGEKVLKRRDSEMRYTLEEEQRMLSRMRQGIKNYVAEQKALGHHPCEILLRYVAELEGADVEIESPEIVEEFDYE